MKISEKELEDFLFHHLDAGNIDYLKTIGLNPNFIKGLNYFRQLNLGDYGIADIVGIKLFPRIDSGLKQASVTVIELKEGIVEEKTIIQILRYVGGLEESLAQSGYTTNFNLMTIGSGIDPCLLKNLNLIAPYICHHSYNLSLSGIKFLNSDILNYGVEYLDLTEETQYNLIPDCGIKVSTLVKDLELIYNQDCQLKTQ